MNLLLLTPKRVLTITSVAAVFCCSLPAQEASVPQPVTVASRPLITDVIDESRRTLLKGNTHPLARPEFDLGTAPATLPMSRMLLVLKRSPEQEGALRKLLDDQQDKRSPSYHKWLTPAQFGKQFGPMDADIQTVTSWLQGHGFQVGTTKGRTVLEFSGSASQVQETFHTSIHKYVVNGEQHWANASDPSIPAALTPAVAGVLTLHNFLKKPQIRFSKQKVAGKMRPGKFPALTFTDGTHGMAPGDFDTIYNSTPTLNENISGSGITIGVIGRSNLYSVDSPGEDVADFRTDAFELCCGTFNIVLNGPDPGDLGGGEEAEATLDTSWSGAVAPGATVDLVVSATTNTSDGIDLSEVYIIENNLADVMTESFGTCEAESGTAEAAGTSALAEQAAAQGISYFVSTGDSGAEGCDSPDSETIASGPVSASLLASTPFNVAVGGTIFNDASDPSKYWGPSSPDPATALSYIPEDIWNDSCLSSSCGTSANISAGGGGSSIFFSKPTWQSGAGVLNDNARDLPDVSLTAAPHDGYLLCLEASCLPDAQGDFYIYLVGGTSASTPSFAGIMALVDQQMTGRQGLPNYILYRLAASEANLGLCNGSNTTTPPASACIFNDVTAGNNAVPGELNYGLSSALYQAGAGYDMASGLGSVNIANLVSQWNSVTFNPTITTLALTPMTGIPHGTTVNVNIAVAPSSGTGNPTGDVSLIASTGSSSSAQTAVDGFTLSGTSTVVSSTDQLPGGTYNVQAHYAGDATYAASDSTSVQVTVSAESSTTGLSVLTADANGNAIPFTSGPFGSFVYLRADVAGTSLHGTPTGTVTFSDAFGAIPGGGSFQLNAGDQLNDGSNTATPNGIFNFDTGAHTITASYAGDASFGPSNSSALRFSIQPGFFAAIASNQAQVVISAPGVSGTTSVAVSSSTGFTGTIALSCSGLPSGAACAFTPASVKASGTATTTNCSISVSTTAAAAMLRAPGRPVFERWLAVGGFMFFSVFFIGAPKGRRSSRTLLLLLASIVLVPGCGGGGSKTPTPAPVAATLAGTYNIVVSATSGSVTSTTGFTLFVQ